jgi:hypothetical protein
MANSTCHRMRHVQGLNVGGGGGGTLEIRVRLRAAGRVSDFLPYESVLGTMLHELAHNIVGPHDASFYKLLDDLSKVRMGGGGGAWGGGAGCGGWLPAAHCPAASCKPQHRYSWQVRLTRLSRLPASPAGMR